MKRSIVGIMAAAMALAASLVWYSCTKDNDEDMTGTIYGTVTDYATGEPIGNANVKLRPSGETTLTGMDGTFQFNNLKEGKYSLSLSKNGYVDLDDDYVINLSGGDNIRRDIQMRSQTSSFQIAINGNEVDTIDFGADPSFEELSFTVLNDGTMEFDVTLRVSTSWLYFYRPNYEGSSHYYNYSDWWVNDLSPNTGTVRSLRIAREALQIGENVGYMYVSAGTLTKTYVIKATGLGMPVVTDPTITNKTSNTCVAHSSVTDNGGWNIVDKGFEYHYDGYNSYTSSLSCGPGENNFQAQIPVGTSVNGNKVRAYASNGVYKAYSGWKYINN